MKFIESRAFRLLVTGLVSAVVAAIFTLWLLPAKADTGRTPLEARNATPVEISQAALEGQIEALRKSGFDEGCLFEIKMYGEMCIEQCVTRGEGFALHLEGELPTCAVKHCSCEGEPLEPAS